MQECTIETRDSERFGEDWKRNEGKQNACYNIEQCNSLELVRKIHMTPVQFSLENDTMTPTLKIKRYQAGKMYEKEIKDLYAEPISQQ